MDSQNEFKANGGVDHKDHLQKIKEPLCDNSLLQQTALEEPSINDDFSVDKGCARVKFSSELSSETNPNHAKKFVSTLAGDKPVTFQTFPDRKDDSSASSTPTKILHGTLENRADAPADLNSKEAGMFMMINQGDGRGRRSENPNGSNGNSFETIGSAFPGCPEIAASKRKELPVAPSMWKNPRIVFRYDAVEIYLDITKRNMDFLCKCAFPHLFEDLRRGLGGWHKPELRTRFSIRPQKYWGWRHKMTAETVKLEIFGPTFQLGEPKRMTSESPPKNIRSRLYPSYQEMMDHGYKRDYLGMIRVTNPLKLHYAIYQEVLKDIVYALEMHLDLIPKKVEVCLDTTDPYKGKLMILSALPSYFKPSMLYHFDQDGKMVRGPSPIGEHEYVGYRPKGRQDKRPTSERPRGGRRVCHPHLHVEEIRGHAVHIYRCEYQLYTTYLRELMKRRKIYDVTTLLNFLPYLSPRLFRFRTLDLEGLYRHYPNTRQLRLETLSIRGQYYVLSQNGFEPKEISQYLRVAPITDIVFYDDHDRPFGWPFTGIYTGIVLQDSTLIELPPSTVLTTALWVDLQD